MISVGRTEIKMACTGRGTRTVPPLLYNYVVEGKKIQFRARYIFPKQYISENFKLKQICTKRLFSHLQALMEKIVKELYFESLKFFQFRHLGN